MAGFGAYESALQLRNIIKDVAAETIEKLRPRAKYGTVTGINVATGQASVLFPGDPQSVLVNMGQNVPQRTGVRVRVGGVAGDKYIEHIIGGSRQQVYDTRSSNETPGWYWINHPSQVVSELKESNVLGISGVEYFGVLDTSVPHDSSSGGSIVQRFSSGGNVLRRTSVSSSAWTSWVSEMRPDAPLVPSGVIVPWGGVAGSVPSGYFPCDGRTISRTEWPALYAAIGTTHGSGNGSTTFNIPNLLGRIPVGWSGSGKFTSVGQTGGADSVTLTSAQLPAISGTVAIHGGEGGSGLWGPTGAFSSSPTVSGYRAPNGTTAAVNSIRELKFSVGGNGSHENMPPYITLYYIIKN